MSTISVARIVFMKIKFTETDYGSLTELSERNKKPHKKPIRPNIFWRTLMRIVAAPDLIATKFKYEKIGMEKIGKGEPAFYLMNHSSFIDLEIAATVLYPKPFNIVATTDGFIGKDWLMHKIGCIPARKFVSDPALVKDMLYASRKLKNNILMYPEVGYSFDGRATTLPDTIGKCIKMLGMPLVMIRTYGAFTRDPLYNYLQKRRVKVSARVECLLSSEEVAEKSAEEITEIVFGEFSFDNFRWQKENRVYVSEDFRADGLGRVCYKCPECNQEGKTVGKGVHLVCENCGAKHILTELGELHCLTDKETLFTSVPAWYAWERDCVRRELESGEYSVEFPVEIFAAVDTKRLYSIGSGYFKHDSEGFHLTTDDGQLDYRQKPTAQYSVNADLNWYELGDIISVGDLKCLFYCLPKAEGVSVAKIRLAAEEAYKIEWAKKNAKNG